MYDEIDLEDIECRLYSQVYHSNVENEETNVSSQPTITSYVINKIHNNRYFSKRHISGQSVFIPLEQESTTISNKTYPSVCNSISFNPNSTAIATEENIGSQIQNNITVNQYTLPLIINPDLNEVLNPRYSAGKLFVPWSNKNKKLLDKRNRKQQRRLENRRRKNKEKRNQNPVSNSCVELNGNIQRKQANHIVFISDESDNECIIINEMSKKTLKSNKKPEVYNTQDGVRSESDDDIIYIPPPPVEVINVDVEEEATGNIHKVSDNTVSTISEKVLTSAELVISSNKSNNHPSDTNELSNTLECCTSNDFLDNSNIENNTSKFNFSLHGSDFNSTGDFLRPANPVDYCETESSCSTNDFNRENSSVKTVVFNEVDFPREDIFSDKNLEGFSSYITPKRDMSKTTKVPSKAPKSAISTVNKISNESETSLSSSESEYESFNILNRSNKVGDMESNKKLPTLSPMHGEKVVSSTKKVTEKKPVKSSSNKVQTTHNTRNHSSKRKSNAVDSTESDSDIDEEQLKIKTRKLTKKKKKASNKKKNPSEELDKNISADLQNQNTEVNKDCNDGSNTDGGENISTVVCETRVKKKVKNSLEKVLDNEKHLKQTDNDIYNHVKDINTEDSVQIINEDVESNTNLMNMSRKKKKKNSSNCRKSEEDSTSFSGSDRTAIEKVKKKKKKSGSSENFGNSDLNQTETEIIDINSANTENQSSNNRDHSTLNDNKRSISSLEAFEPQNEKINLCAKQAENKCDSDKNREDFTQNINNTKNVFAENESDEEIIVVDEVVFHESDANTEDHIVVSSDSEYDFRQLEDVGQNLELANCVANGAVNKIGTDDSENNFYAVNKNLCEDYSKFDVEQIQNTQSDDPENWKVLPKDESTFLNCNNSKGPRCNRCRQFGHIGVRCTEKPYPPRCTLCGFSGHQEPRCPNKRCTQCGNEGDYSTTYCWKCIKFRNSMCRICNMRGHIAKACPDLWRRYHLTTQEGPIVISQEPQLKPRDQLWCSGCASQGHLEHECNYYNREYPPTNPCVSSYEDVLNQEDTSRFSNTIPTPPPPPVWNVRNQNNLYNNMSSFPSFPSTSQGIPYNTPIFIPPLMSQIIDPNQIFPVPALLGQNRMMIPNCTISSNPSLPPMLTKVLNPFSVLVKQGEDAAKHRILNKMMVDYINEVNDINYVGCYESNKSKVIHPHMVKQEANELLKINQRRIKQIIMSMPSRGVRQFLTKELADLENVVSQSDPKYLRKKLFKYEKISQSKRVLHCDVVKEKCFWYRILNMYIFGVHHFRDGKIHINYIKAYVSEPKQNKLDNHKRKSLLNAYNYIFGGDRHVNVNYYKIIQQLIEKSSGS